MTWNKTEIRAARKVALAPLLLRRGLRLLPKPQDNFLVTTYDDLMVKDCYWRWPSRNLQGNAIDFFTLVERLSFQDAMAILLPPPNSS